MDEEGAMFLSLVESGIAWEWIVSKKTCAHETRANKYISAPAK